MAPSSRFEDRFWLICRWLTCGLPLPYEKTWQQHVWIAEARREKPDVS